MLFHRETWNADQAEHLIEDRHQDRPAAYSEETCEKAGDRTGNDEREAEPDEIVNWGHGEPGKWNCERRVTVSTALTLSARKEKASVTIL